MFIRMVVGIGLVFVCLSGVQHSFAAPAGVTISVNTTADEVNGNASCSLREAVQAANSDRAVGACPAGNGPDTIIVPAGTYTLNLQSAGGLEISTPITLSGASATSTIIDANGDGRTGLTLAFDNLFVCDAGADGIDVFDGFGHAAGALVAPPGNGGLSLPNAVFVGYEGDALYVSDFSAGVKRFKLPSGAFSDTIVANSGSYGTYNTLAATDMLLLPGVYEMLVADYYPPAAPLSPGRVLRFNTQTGAFLGEFVGPGSGGLKTPNSLALLGAHVYVTDASSNNVLRYTKATGAFVDVFVSAGSGGLNRPRDLIFSGANLLVASEETDQVLRYNATTGNFVGVFVSAGSGGLDKPQGMTLGPDGHLYVSSAGTNQLLRYNGATGAFIDVFVDTDQGVNGIVGCPTFVPGQVFGPTVKLKNITVRNSVQNGNPGSGHGIFNSAHVVLELTDSIVRDNRSNSPGAGIANGGDLTVRRSTITANQTLTGTLGGTQYSGGGIMNFKDARARIFDSTISNNIAVRGAGVRNAGGTLEITNSTVSGNIAQARGGGIMNFGDASIRFSTITNNTVFMSLWSGTDPGAEDTYGGGIYNNGDLRIANSILAGNRDNRTRFDAGFAPDCWSGGADSVIQSRRGNIIGVKNALCPMPDVTLDQVGTDSAPLSAGIAALANNGGPMLTHAPLPTSPAVDSAVTSLVLCPLADQRAAPRAVDGDDNGSAVCDVGAVELGGIVPVVTLTVHLPFVARP